MKYTVGICDDAEEMHSILIEYIKGIDPMLSFDFMCYTSGRDLLNDWNDSIDILFLDINLNEDNGIEVAKALRKSSQNLPIIFITGYQEHAYTSYEVDTTHFIVKPVKAEAVAVALTRAFSRIKAEQYRMEFEETFIVKDTKFYFDEIYYFQKVGKSIRVVHTNGEMTFNDTIKNLSNNVPNHIFMQSHKHTIINIAKVKKLQNGVAVFTETIHAPISRRLYPMVKKSFEKIIFKF